MSLVVALSRTPSRCDLRAAAPVPEHSPAQGPSLLPSPSVAQGEPCCWPELPALPAASPGKHLPPASDKALAICAERRTQKPATPSCTVPPRLKGPQPLAAPLSFSPLYKKSQSQDGEQQQLKFLNPSCFLPLPKPLLLPYPGRWGSPTPSCQRNRDVVCFFVTVMKCL